MLVMYLKLNIINKIFARMGCYAARLVVTAVQGNPLVPYWKVKQSKKKYNKYKKDILLTIKFTDSFSEVTCSSRKRMFLRLSKGEK
jgi:hypothetical protein